MLAAVVRLLRKSRRAAEDEGSRRKRNRVLLAACGFACLLLMQLALEDSERRQDLTSMNICLWMHETRSGAAGFARGLGYRVSARSAVAQSSSQQTEVVVIPCAQVRGQWPETLCPYTRSAIKHDNLYMGLLASLTFTHPPSVRTMHARRISP